MGPKEVLDFRVPGFMEKSLDPVYLRHAALDEFDEPVQRLAKPRMGVGAEIRRLGQLARLGARQGLGMLAGRRARRLGGGLHSRRWRRLSPSWRCQQDCR